MLNLIESIQELCFGAAPAQLSDLRNAFGKREFIGIDRVPYNYPTRMLLHSFWGKKSDFVFASSVMRQISAMLNPRYARYVIDIFKDRKARDTY